MSIDISKLSPDQLERFIHLQSLVDRQQAAAQKVQACRDYYKGEHPVLLTQRQQEFLGKQLTEGEFAFNHNVIRSCVDTLRERLSVEGFTVNGQAAGDDTPDAQLAALLWQWWTDSGMAGQQIRVHRRALRDGLTYVMVDYDQENARPRFALHEVDDGKEGIVLHRDPSDENAVLFGSRYFFTFDLLSPGQTGVERKTVYLPGEIRKYKRNGRVVGQWEPVMDDGDLSWPLPWLDRRGKPVGVATVEFQNPGGSEVEHVAGLQNALNKAWLDLLAAADANGFPILTMNYRDPQPQPVAVQDDDDLEDGDEFIVAPGRALEIFGGTIDRLEASDLGSLIDVVWNVVNAISGVTRTPHQFLRPFLTADIPSGEALKQLESGLVARAKERQLLFGQAWAEAMKLALRVAWTFGDAPEPPKKLNIGVQWADPNTRMERTEAEIAGLHKGLGVPDDAVWSRAGYSPEQVAQFKKNAAAQRAAEIASIAAAARLGQNRSQSQAQPPAQGVA